MQLFLHITGKIRVISGAAEWSGTPDEFAALEPDYPGLPAGKTLRYQTPEIAYLDGDARAEDTIDALQYCANIGSYPPGSFAPESLIDDTTTAADSTWSSNKIASEIASGGGSGAVASDVDTVVIEYLDNDHITVLAGGKFTDSAGTLYQISTNVTVSSTANLTAADTLTADTYYYLWGGEDSSGDLAFVLSDDGDVLPVELVQGRCLRPGVSIYDNGSSLDIRPFRYDGLWYQYTTAILLYDATMPTTNTTIDLSAYVPANVRRGVFWSSSSYVTSSFSLTEDLITIDDMFVSNGDYIYITVVKSSANATFEAAISRNINFRCYYAYPYGILRLIRWRI